MRDIASREIELATEMELKATVVYEESEEYYEWWIKQKQKDKKKFGLTCSYDMGWQRISSGNNYASLSGHAFVIGAHTRRESKVFNHTGSSITSNPPPSAPATVISLPQESTITPTTDMDVSNIDSTLPAYDVEDLGAEETDQEETTIAGYLDVSLLGHECTRNYDGSSGAMESDGLLLMVMKMHKRYDGEKFLDYVITDDDIKMKSYIKHPKTRPKGKKNIGGSFPKHIPVPNWYADPTHRAKFMAGLFFELTKGKKAEVRGNKLDTLRMKKYYSYFINQNRSNGIS